MQKRRLGKTGLQVSQVGFGGTWIAQLSHEEAIKVLRKAFELGINYFDTAKTDGDSEEKIGAALKGVRDQCIIATKMGSRTKRESVKALKDSLRLLQTDKIDIIQLHGIDDEQTLRKVIGEEGVLQTCKKARREGIVDFIGISSHKPWLLMKAIDTGEFDTVLVPINVVARQALEELVPYAKAHDVGVVSMKPFSLKTSTLITCLYNPSLSLLSNEPELKTLLGNDTASMAQNALRFVLSQDISVVIPGLKSIQEVQIAANTGNQYTGLTDKEKKHFRVQFEGLYCRDCGFCLPCPQKIDIAAILRFKMLSDTYGLKQWAKKLYSGLEKKANQCTNCGECEPKCPYHLPIVKMLKDAEKKIG
jgi:uncharacterized protein